MNIIIIILLAVIAALVLTGVMILLVKSKGNNQPVDNKNTENDSNSELVDRLIEYEKSKAYGKAFVTASHLIGIILGISREYTDEKNLRMAIESEFTPISAGVIEMFRNDFKNCRDASFDEDGLRSYYKALTTDRLEQYAEKLKHYGIMRSFMHDVRNSMIDIADIVENGADMSSFKIKANEIRGCLERNGIWEMYITDFEPDSRNRLEYTMIYNPQTNTPGLYIRNGDRYMLLGVKGCHKS